MLKLVNSSGNHQLGAIAGTCASMLRSLLLRGMLVVRFSGSSGPDVHSLLCAKTSCLWSLENCNRATHMVMFSFVQPAAPM